MKDNVKEWFSQWFNTPWYHILYKHRNQEEAASFIDNILDFLKIPLNKHILDCACGKGRHSIYLNKKGYKVTGIDLSEESINEALKQKNEHLDFVVNDMRALSFSNEFDVVMNMFTSFGYFENEQENINTLQNFNNALKADGILIIDFLNAEKVKNNLLEWETQTIDGVEFNIRRKLKDNFFIKEIEFTDKGQDYHFEERVMAISRKDFEKYFNFTGFKLLHIFGSYQLDPFNAENSDRLILVAQKIS